MKEQYLQQLIKKFPNNYELGQAVRKFYHLLNEGLPVEECEKEILDSSFSLS